MICANFKKIQIGFKKQYLVSSQKIISITKKGNFFRKLRKEILDKFLAFDNIPNHI